MTDFWKPYENFVPHEKHTQSKAQTYTIEGYNKQSVLTSFGQAQEKVEMLQQKQKDASIFCDAPDVKMEWLFKGYT